MPERCGPPAASFGFVRVRDSFEGVPNSPGMMKPTTFLLMLAVAPLAGEAQTLRISEVPRATQMGPPPAPEGAPGKGRYTPPLPADDALPTIWLIGDSTVRNGTMGESCEDGQWGWGAPITAFFDPDEVNVVNRAFGGTSSRTFYHGFFWKNLRPLIEEGDFVIIQFGANDNGGAKGKGALPGTGENTETVTRDGEEEVVHSFGWYLRQYVDETREQGATPVLCSLTPRKRWTEDGRFQRPEGGHAAWTAEVAREQNVAFVDLHELIARRYEELGREKVDTFFVPAPKEHLHTGWDGAVVNAGLVVAGLKAYPTNPMIGFLSERGEAVRPAELPQLER